MIYVYYFSTSNWLPGTHNQKIVSHTYVTQILQTVSSKSPPRNKFTFYKSPVHYKNTEEYDTRVIYLVTIAWPKEGPRVLPRSEDGMWNEYLFLFQHATFTTLHCLYWNASTYIHVYMYIIYVCIHIYVNVIHGKYRACLLTATAASLRMKWRNWRGPSFMGFVT